jgi:hypothetical protein
MVRCVFWLLIAVSMASPGCGRSDAPSPAVPAPDNLNANGIRYDLPISGSDMDRAIEFLKAVKPDGL